MFCPTEFLCDDYFAGMSPKQGSIDPSWLMPVSYIALAMLPDSLSDRKHFAHVLCRWYYSVGKNHVLPYRVSLRRLLRWNVTKARKHWAELTDASWLHNTCYVARFIVRSEAFCTYPLPVVLFGREKSCFALPSFSATITSLECHQSKGVLIRAD